MSFKLDETSIIALDGTPSPFGLEVVYVDDIPGPTIDRQPELQFQSDAVARAVQRGKDFAALFPRGELRYVTNSMALVRTYAAHFEAAGLNNYSFRVIPAVWGGP